MNRRTYMAVVAILFSSIGMGGMLDAASYTTGQVVVKAETAREMIQKRPKTVTVVGKKEIKEKKMQNLRDVLESVPGMSFSIDPMNRTNYSLRGAESRHVPIMMDGMKISGELAKLAGAANELERFSTEDIERVEITHGISGARYGADAIGGVINIITKRPQKTGGYLEVEARQTAHDHQGEQIYHMGYNLVDTHKQVKLWGSWSKTAPHYNHAYWDYDFTLIDPNNRYHDFKKSKILEQMETAKMPKKASQISDNYFGKRSQWGATFYWQPQDSTEISYAYDKMIDDTQTRNFLGRINLGHMNIGMGWDFVNDKNKDLFWTTYLQGMNHIIRDNHMLSVRHFWDKGELRLRIKDSMYHKHFATLMRTVMYNRYKTDYMESNDRTYELTWEGYPNQQHGVTLTTQVKTNYGMGSRMIVPGHRVQDYVARIGEGNIFDPNVEELTKEKNMYIEAIPMYRADMREWNVSLADDWQINKQWRILPIIRYTHHTTGNQFSGEIGTVYAHKNTKIKFNIGTGFSTPGIMERYHAFLMMPLSVLWEKGPKTNYCLNPKYPEDKRIYYYPGWWWEGNPQLQPEKAFGMDLSLEKRYRKSKAKITAFYNNIRDYMNFFRTDRKLPPNHPANLQKKKNAIYWIYSYNNLDRVTLSGLEAEYTQYINPYWTMTASATYLHSIETKTGKRLTMKPEMKYLFTLRYKKDKWSGSFWGEYSTKYIDIFDKKYIRVDIADGIPKNYGIWNMIIERQQNKNYSIYAGVNNIFNYESPSLGIYGRVIRVGLSAKM